MPDFLFNNIVKTIMSEKVGLKYCLGYLFVLIFQIPFLVMNIYKFKKRRENSDKKTALVKEEEKNTELTLKNESDVLLHLNLLIIGFKIHHIN